ncbi:calcium-binding protein [Trichothermofontia sichuanensis B231]|uniref:calcium-binding protein n=1 Tax=Trichothermofontia sichuanensis TaxID=3045816 RepID=UPI002247C965|nr:calcium-binding protein [Trichothermofontia sichuanensis]UZQ55056.1 calcium-binding protein [Trichothermofontia sichuanensis B231]
MIGTSGGDQIQGGSRPNFIAGLGGNDVLSGGAGNDTIRGGKGADVIDGEDGDDTCYGDRDDDIATGGKGNDVISGGKGNDQLFGDEGEDTLLGGIRIDVLEGGPGTDVLILWAAEANADPNQVDRLFYNDLEDFIGLTDGLSFDSLTFELVDAGAGSAPDTLIRIAGGRALGIVLDTMPTDLNPPDFVAV